MKNFYGYQNTYSLLIYCALTFERFYKMGKSLYFILIAASAISGL